MITKQTMIRERVIAEKRIAQRFLIPIRMSAKSFGDYTDSTKSSFEISATVFESSPMSETLIR